jgi:hypothetical protein
MSVRTRFTSPGPAFNSEFDHINFISNYSKQKTHAPITGPHFRINPRGLKYDSRSILNAMPCGLKGLGENPQGSAKIK